MPSFSSENVSRSFLGLPGGSDGKEFACNVRDLGSISRSGRFLGVKGNPLQYSCLENSMDRGALWTTVHGVTESDMTEQPTHTHTQKHTHTHALTCLKQPCIPCPFC